MGIWNTPFSGGFRSLILSVGVWLPMTLHILLITMCAVYFNWLMGSYHLLYKATSLPGFFYLFFQLSLFGQGEFSSSVLAGPLVLIAFHLLLELFDKPGYPAGQLFWLGIVLWLGILIYFDMLFLLLAFLPALMIVRPASFREFLLVVFGAVIAFYFTWAMYKLAFNGKGFSDYGRLFYYSISFSKLRVSPVASVFLILTAVILGLSMFRQYSNYYKNNVRTRTIQRFLLLFLLAGIVLCIFSAHPLYANLGFLAPALGYFFAYYFIEKGKGYWKNILLFALLSLCLIGHMEGLHL